MSRDKKSQRQFVHQTKSHCNFLFRTKCRCNILASTKYRSDNLHWKKVVVIFCSGQNVVTTFSTVLVLQQPQGSLGCCNDINKTKSRSDILFRTNCFCSGTKCHRDILTRSKCCYNIYTWTNYRCDILDGINYRNNIFTRPKCRYDNLYH